MKKLFSLTLAAMFFSFASFALGPISGSTGCCVGGTGYVIDSLYPGGTWSSSNTAVATVGLTTGYVYGVSPGVVTLTYTLGGSYVTDTFRVTAAPGPITGTTSLCSGGVGHLSDATPGGAWTTGAPGIATINPSNGTIYAVSPGTVFFNYIVGAGCSVYTMDTVFGISTPYITGPSTVCAGSTITLTDSISTGSGTVAWSSSNPSVATVSGSGIVTGVSVGSATITLAITGSCGTVYGYRTITVINTTYPATITGSSAIMVGSNTTLYASVSGGIWSTSTPSIATVSASGVVTGLAVGTSYITYTITGCGGTASSYDTITVNPFDGISGMVHFTSAAYYGAVKVWLITYNASTLDLEAYDSLVCYASGTSAYYQFLSVPTDTYRVKAAALDTMSTPTTGYIPTYHTASYYWYSANVIPHTSGTGDINKDINMAYGTTTSGPGFIGGNVTTGANKGTSGGVPVVGLSMNVLNSSNVLIQTVRTDAAGAYSFSNLPAGTYYVFPDSLNYMTTPYTGITLTASSPSMSVAHFTQHTITKTITPVAAAVSNVSGNTSTVIAFPSPTSGKLNIQWNVNAAETANVMITDVTGRVVYTGNVDMNRGAGIKQLDLSGFTNGLYLITVKSASLNYTTKIQVQH